MSSGNVRAERLEACVCCRTAGGTPAFASLRRCTSCGHVWSPAPITHDDIERIYDTGYFSGEEYASYIDDRSQFEANFARRLETLRQHIDPARHRRLLEVGCAHGFFLNAARSMFESVHGIDISGDAVRYAREQFNLDVSRSDPALTLPPGGFDAVCLWDTIEHLRQPDQCLDAIGRQTADGAILALTTGDIGSLNARLRGARWRLIHPPTHIHYFTRTSITRLLDRVGFDVISFEHCGFSRRLGAMMTTLLKGRSKTVVRVCRQLGRPFEDCSLYLNLGDIMCVVARRRL